MYFVNKSISVFLTFSLIFGQINFIPEASASEANSNLERPPQYVAISFDGSYNNTMWNRILNFSDSVKDSTPAKFTFFISGVYFLKRMSKPQKNYPNPQNSFNDGCSSYSSCKYRGGYWNTHRYYVLPKMIQGSTKRNVRGYSAIGFGDYNDDIVQRIANVNKAYKRGHEIGSHANAHVNGDTFKWSKSDWDKEFDQFTDILYNYGSINNISQTTLGVNQTDSEKRRLLSLYRSNDTMKVPERELKGFRAPQLGSGPIVGGEPTSFPSLDDHSYTYDASMIRKSWIWPKKEYNSDIYVMPLASLKIIKRDANNRPYNSGSRVPSMDYNFYFKQTGAKPIPNSDPAKNKKLRKFEQEVVDTYQDYFDKNYFGNRAPVHIGHHFSTWNNGIYWKALQRFIKNNCGKPEVKCVTYKELEKYLDEKGPSKVVQFEKGNFPKYSRSAISSSNAAIREVPEFNINANVTQYRGNNILKVDTEIINPSLSAEASKLKVYKDGELIESLDLNSDEKEVDLNIPTILSAKNDEVISGNLLEFKLLNAEGEVLVEDSKFFKKIEIISNGRSLETLEIHNDVAEVYSMLGDSSCAHDEKNDHHHHNHEDGVNGHDCNPYIEYNKSLINKL